MNGTGITRFPFLFIIAASISILSGCVSINGVELSPEGLAREAVRRAVTGIATGVRSSSYTGRSTRLVENLKKYPMDEYGKVHPMFVLSLESDYQEVLNEIVSLIRDIQRNAPPGSKLVDKGLIKDIKLTVTTNEEVNASARDDLVQPSIAIPSRVITDTLARLRQEHLAEQEEYDELPLLLKGFKGFTSYVPVIEFEEVVRFILAHEATHIWLHRPGLSIREREIEADAWGVLLSSQLSNAFKFRVKAGRAAIFGGFSTNNPYEFSMLSSRTGSDVLFYLYGNNGVFYRSTERESLEERQASIENKYDEVMSEYYESLSDVDTIAFKLLRIPFGSNL